MSFQNNTESYDKLPNINNMMGISFIDILKPNIKTKQNDKVIKTLDIIKDGPEAYIELLLVAIIHQNIEITKLIIEQYIESEIDSPYINSLIFYNSILPEDSKYKLNDIKDNYSEIICPFVIMAGIGGNIDIFNYLMNHDLINDLNTIGTIGLSKIYKNAINSNIIGACAFYGNYMLLEYLLKNHRLEVDINIVASEEKVRTNKKQFLKEMEGASTPLLACGGPASDDKTFEVLKILEEYKVNFEDKDFNGNNIIHIATRNNKIKTLKFLINSLELKDFMNEKNNDNLTPIDIAEQMKNNEIISFFKGKEIIEDKNDEENEKEDSGNSIQKNQNNDKNEENNKGKESENINNYSNKKNYKRDYKDNYNKNYKYKNNFRNNYDYNNNYKNNYNNNYKNNYNSNNSYYDNNNNYTKKKGSGMYKTTNQRNYYNNNTYYSQKSQNRYYENNTYRNNNSFKRNQNSYYEINSKDNNNQTIDDKIKEKTENIDNNKEIPEIEETKKEEININKSNNNSNIDDTKKDEEEDIEDGSFSEEDFLNEKEENISKKEENISQNINYNEYKELYKKYMDIERKCYNLEKEKKEMYLYINKMNMDKKTKINNIKSNEENINSLLNIANEELKVKNKYINELKKDCIMTDLSNIKNFNKEKLEKYKEFYYKNLNIIDNALKGHV